MLEDLEQDMLLASLLALAFWCSMAGLAAGPGSAAFPVAYSTLTNLLPTSACSTAAGPDTILDKLLALRHEFYLRYYCSARS